MPENTIVHTAQHTLGVRAGLSRVGGLHVCNPSQFATVSRLASFLRDTLNDRVQLRCVEHSELDETYQTVVAVLLETDGDLHDLGYALVLDDHGDCAVIHLEFWGGGSVDWSSGAVEFPTFESCIKDAVELAAEEAKTQSAIGVSPGCAAEVWHAVQSQLESRDVPREAYRIPPPDPRDDITVIYVDVGCASDFPRLCLRADGTAKVLASKEACNFATLTNWQPYSPSHVAKLCDAAIAHLELS